MPRRLVPVLVALAAPALAMAGVTSWSLDPAHTRASFTVRHLVISNVRGELGKTTGTVLLDEEDVTRSSVEATIDVTAIDTRVASRDADLRSPAFFDVARFPTMTFRSTRVERVGEGRLKVTGDLTIKGVTRPVALEVEGPTAEIKGPMGERRRGVSARTTINRRDFGLDWSRMVEAGPVVGDEVKVEIEAELVKAATGERAAG